jgi:KDEL-tailed cysteine endopeptidase
MVEFGKEYSTEGERQYRFKKFAENYVFVTLHNLRFSKGLEQYDLELNIFADLDRVEFKARHTGYKGKGITKVCTGKVKPVSNPPASVDWSVKGVVTPVKNQGNCGSCWAFSTTGSLEGLAAIEKGKLLSLSEQQLVDCAGGDYGNDGCGGGYMDSAMWYVIDNGITDAATYPYSAHVLFTIDSESKMRLQRHTEGLPD